MEQVLLDRSGDGGREHCPEAVEHKEMQPAAPNEPRLIVIDVTAQAASGQVGEPEHVHERVPKQPQD